MEKKGKKKADAFFTRHVNRKTGRREKKRWEKNDPTTAVKRKKKRSSGMSASWSAWEKGGRKKKKKGRKKAIPDMVMRKKGEGRPPYICPKKEKIGKIKGKTRRRHNWGKKKRAFVVRGYRNGIGKKEERGRKKGSGRAYQAVPGKRKKKGRKGDTTIPSRVRKKETRRNQKRKTGEALQAGRLLKERKSARTKF